jgi:hypothetical protein
MKIKFCKHSDILLNIIAPLLLGILIYFIAGTSPVPALVKNHLADGLWAYAFISSILIIWNRELNPIWILTAFIISVCIELLQWYHTIEGTGDMYDMATYCLFFIISLKLNKFFKTRFNF